MSQGEVAVPVNASAAGSAVHWLVADLAHLFLVGPHDVPDVCQGQLWVCQLQPLEVSGCTPLLALLISQL